MLQSNKKLFIVALLGLPAAACGEKKDAPKVPASTTSGSTDRDAGTTAKGNDKIEPATMDVTAEGKTDAGLFIGVVGEPVPWTFTGVAAESGRDVAILLNKIPKGATIDPPQDGTGAYTSVKVNWAPDTPQTSKDDMEIYARDLTRCKALESGDKCFAAKPLKKYDVMIAAVKWEVVKAEAVQATTGSGEASSSTSTEVASGDTPPDDGIVVKVSDPNCGGIKGTTNEQIQGTVLQTGLKVLTGGGLQALLPGLLSTLVNSKGASPGGATKPTKC